MDKAELIEIAKRGEDSRHQFKVDVMNPDSLAAEVVALLNASGGFVFIGIDDKSDGDDGIKAVDEGIKPSEGGIKAANEGIKPGNEGMSEGLKSIVLSHPGIRVPQLATHLRRSRQTIERYVADLKRQGIIEYRGSKKTGGYYLK